MSIGELMGDVGKFYPGSKELRAVNPLPDVAPDETPDLGPGKVLIAGGREVEFWGIGTLARVLNRQPVTIRSWEKDGILPGPTFNKPGVGGDLRGRRRLYTAPQILGIWEIARDEGVLDPGPRVNIHKTQFPLRVKRLFDRLKREGFR